MNNDYSKQVLKILNQNKKYNTIGLFDSGIGGLSVVNELVRLKPNSNIIYIGDNLNFPYGNKKEEQLLDLIKKNIDYLLNKNISVLGIACNTATSVIHSNFNYLLQSPLVFNPISSVDSYIERNVNIKRVLVIGTEFTVKSKIYSDILSNIEKLIVIENSEQLLIENIEKSEKENIQAELKRILKYINKNNIDTLILGCTHYGYIKNIFKSVMGDTVTIIDPSELMATELISNTNIQGGNGIRDISFTKALPKQKP